MGVDNMKHLNLFIVNNYMYGFQAELYLKIDNIPFIFTKRIQHFIEKLILFSPDLLENDNESS